MCVNTIITKTGPLFSRFCAEMRVFLPKFCTRICADSWLAADRLPRGKRKEVVSQWTSTDCSASDGLPVHWLSKKRLELGLPDSRNNVMNGFRVSDWVLL
jgi:hypothetical protein